MSTEHLITKKMATGTYTKTRPVVSGPQEYALAIMPIGDGAVSTTDSVALRHVRVFGQPLHDNRLIYGDNEVVLRSLLVQGLAGAVRLVYIDPPFATGAGFESNHVGMAFFDNQLGADYIRALGARIRLLYNLLAEDGSMYLHLDANMLFPAKLLMDEIFGAHQFNGLITRIKCNPKNHAKRQFGDVCDYLLFYTKSDEYVWNFPIEPWAAGEGEAEYHCVEPESGRHYKKVPCHLPGVRNGETGLPWRGKLPPPGKHWVNSPRRLDELDAMGRIYWSKNGNPRRKLYLDESPGKLRQNIWKDFRDTQNQNARVTGYPTEKNLDMMRMIVEASSNEGDLVLDAYAGSGTTLAAAGVLGRQWIGIDNSPVAIKTAIDRLQNGTPRMGSYARRSYITRSEGESFPDADCGFDLYVSDDVAHLAEQF